MNIAAISSVPWAKFTTRMVPNTMLSPSAISA